MPRAKKVEAPKEELEPKAEQPVAEGQAPLPEPEAPAAAPAPAEAPVATSSSKLISEAERTMKFHHQEQENGLFSIINPEGHIISRDLTISEAERQLENLHRITHK